MDGQFGQSFMLVMKKFRVSSFKYLKVQCYYYRCLSGRKLFPALANTMSSDPLHDNAALKYNLKLNKSTSQTMPVASVSFSCKAKLQNTATDPRAFKTKCIFNN